MPKLKTHSGAKKRFRPRGDGFKYRKASRNHILTKKSHKRKRHLRGQDSVVKVDLRAIVRLLTGS